MHGAGILKEGGFTEAGHQEKDVEQTRRGFGSDERTKAEPLNHIYKQE